jgi:hypothetical protein
MPVEIEYRIRIPSPLGWFLTWQAAKKCFTIDRFTVAAVSMNLGGSYNKRYLLKEEGWMRPSIVRKGADGVVSRGPYLNVFSALP